MNRIYVLLGCLQAVNPGWQKPLKLIKKLITSYGFVKDAWVLDAMCGSGSTSHAALLCGMNSFMFDKVPWKLHSALKRCRAFREMHSEDKELEGEPPKDPSDDDEDEEANADMDVDRENLEGLLDTAGMEVPTDSPALDHGKNVRLQTVCIVKNKFFTIVTNDFTYTSIFHYLCADSQQHEGADSQQQEGDEGVGGGGGIEEGE